MSDPTCLVVMPAYCKDAKDLLWLKEAIQSVEAQTFKDWLLIVADSSPVAYELDQTDPRIRLMRFDRVIPGDVAHKVNQAAGTVQSKFITVMSHDDLMTPWFLEKQVELLDADPTLGFAQPHLIMFGQKVGYWAIAEGQRSADQISQNQFAGTCVIRRDLFDALGGYDASMSPPGHWVGLEDFDLFVGMLRWGWGYKVAPMPLLLSRTGEFQASSQLYGTPKYLDVLELVCRKHGHTLVRSPGGFRFSCAKEPPQPTIPGKA